MTPPESPTQAPVEIRGLNVRRPVNPEDRGLDDALKYITGYRWKNKYRALRTAPDQVQAKSDLGLTLLSTGMIRDAKEISNAMQGITNAELEQGLEYVISAYPLEIAVQGLAYIATNKLAVTLNNDQVREEMKSARDFIAGLIPEKDLRAMWLEKYRNEFPHITLAGLDMRVPPSNKMIDEVKEKLPKSVLLEKPAINYDRRRAPKADDTAGSAKMRV